MPRVDHLTYDLVLDEHIVLKGAAALQVVTLPEFTGSLEAGVLTLRPQRAFTSIEDARHAAESALRAWEISLGLTHALRHPPSFLFRTGELRPLDGEEDSGPSRVTTRYGTIQVSLTVTKEFESLPAPPTAFAATPTVESLWHRYRRALEEREPMQSMAYFVLTVLEGHFDGRHNIGKALHVSRAVITTVARISSERGDYDSARKAVGDGVPLSSKEKIWLRAAVATLIHRLAEHEAGHTSGLLDMTALPSLD